MQEIDVEMKNIELGRTLSYVVEHRQMCRNIRFEHAGIETDGLIADGGEPCPGACVRASEQRNVVSQIDHRVGEVRDDPLGAAIQARWNGFVERRDVRYTKTLLRACTPKASCRDRLCRHGQDPVQTAR